jgi:hypothetical protein
VATAQAGGQVQCACGQRLAVPTLRGLRSLEPASPEAGAKAVAGWTRLHGAVFAAALLVAGAGAAIAAFHGLRYLRVVPYAKDYSPDLIRAEAAHIDELSPVETLTHWSKLVEEGLGPKDPFLWTKAQESAKGLGWWIRLGGELVAGGVLVAVATLFVGRRGK